MTPALPTPVQTGSGSSGRSLLTTSQPRMSGPPGMRGV
jgi:hypothetical protein